MAGLLDKAERSGDVAVSLQGMDPGDIALSAQLYYMLTMLCTDDASKILRTVQKRNGPEAWRR
eukprot:9564223-Lingulodinium_polyedra.AAC.1